VAGRPLRPATRRRLGRLLPHQQADRPRAHPPPKKLSTTIPCEKWSYPVLDPVSRAYPKEGGRLLTCYSPVRRSSTPKGLSARLACVKHAASVRPEPGSNSPSRPYDNPNKAGLPNLKENILTNTRPKGGCVASKKSRHPIRKGTERPGTDPAKRGPVNKALAFNTLLSSQETDTHQTKYPRKRTSTGATLQTGSKPLSNPASSRNDIRPAIHIPFSHNRRSNTEVVEP
jgi:hypothetical protein